MTVKEIQDNLNTEVRLNDPKIYAENSRYILKACVIRKWADGFRISAELEDINNGRSLLIVPIEKIDFSEVENERK